MLFALAPFSKLALACSGTQGRHELSIIYHYSSASALTREQNKGRQAGHRHTHTLHTLVLRAHKREQNHTPTPIPGKFLSKLPPPLNRHTLFEAPVWAWVSPLKTQEGC